MKSMSESEFKLKIFVSCHKPAKIISNKHLIPIQLGASEAKTKIKGMIQDDAGDNISELNSMYCEMTAQYYAWKNVDLDYYGFFHYRRYLSFNRKRFIEDEFGNVIEAYPSDAMIKKYGFDEKIIESLVKRYDVVIPERKNLQRLEGRWNSVREHYKTAPHLHVEDFDLMLDIIDKKYPEYSKVAHDFADGHTMCFCNMYILKK
jgi:hypothetical protein